VHFLISPSDLTSIRLSSRTLTLRRASHRPCSSSIRSRFCFPCHSSCSLLCGSWRMVSSLEVGSWTGMSSGKRTCSGSLLSWAAQHLAGSARRTLTSSSHSWGVSLGTCCAMPAKRTTTADFPAPCSVPLCYVYPAMLHYKACARTWKEKAADIALGVFGVVAAIYTTAQTILVSSLTSYSSQRGSSNAIVNDSLWRNRRPLLHLLGSVVFNFWVSECTGRIL